MRKISSNDVLSFFTKQDLNEEGNSYVQYHCKRYADIINIIEAYRKNDNESILDIGPAFQTMLIREHNKQAHIDTLGYGFGMFEYQEGEAHFPFDLNKSQNESDWIPLPRKYDIIVFTEVIEHLYTSPNFVLKFVRSFLKEDGILILQTPNAVTLPYRVLMLLGRNPFMLLSENPMNHGHFREYTLKELKTYLTTCGYAVVQAYRKNYFYRSTLVYKLFIFACWFLPPSFRQGITIVAKRKNK